MAKRAKQLEYYEAVGRRREAIARVRLYIVGKEKSVTVNGEKLTSGQVVVNKKPFEKVFASNYEKEMMLAPFRLTNSLDRFAVSIQTTGGGLVGQLEAILHGISRALVKVEETHKPSLKKEGLLTRDPRTRERRKVGTGGKARRKKQSPKR